MDLYAHGGHTFWAAAHEISDNGTASVGGDVAGDNWDVSEIAYDKRDLSYAESVAPESSAPLHNRIRDG